MHFEPVAAPMRSFVRRRLCEIFAMAPVVVVIAASANAVTWDEAIVAVEKRAKEYHEKATALGYPVHAGTALNELDIPTHKCAILGRMLGRASIVQHLEKEYPTKSKDGSEFRYAAISLGNWAFTARRLLEIDEARRIRSWNLDCVGQHDIAKTMYIVESGPPAFFDVVDRDILRILGDVTKGFTERLRSALRENPGVKYVALGSGGGSIGEAITAGQLVRAHRLETTLWNNCYSACSLVFLGGTRRTIWSPYPELGFHMASLDGDSLPRNHPIYTAIAGYGLEMGVDPVVLVGAMLSAPPRDMHHLHHEQLCRSRIATWIQRSCQAQADR